MDAKAVNCFLDEYLEAFAACVRGKQELATPLTFYGVPLITQVLPSEVIGVNAVSALYRASLARYDDKGDEIDCPTITYVVTGGDDGSQITMLAAHGG